MWYSPPIPATVLINPVLIPIGSELDEDSESCLSVPEMIGKVPRCRRVHYEGFDMNGNLVAGKADRFHARMLQHECDHINGSLHPTRILHAASFGFKDEIQIARDLGVL